MSRDARCAGSPCGHEYDLRDQIDLYVTASSVRPERFQNTASSSTFGHAVLTSTGWSAD
jgi:hypothetical protein